MEITAKQIADLLQGKLEGNENATINSFAKIEEGKEGAISFLSNPKYTHYLYETKSSVVLVNEDLELQHEVKPTLIRVKNAYESIAQLLQLYDSMKSAKKGIHPMACIDASAKIGKECYVGAFAYIGENVTVGDNVQVYPHVVIEKNVRIGNKCILYPNVSIYHDCVIGNNVIIHSGTVIGADGFGFAPKDDGYEKIPQIGNVVIEDDVEIGANSCVDRSTMGQTVIHKGVKLDNLVQIAHNVEVGENTVMSAQVGVAGSTKIGEWCMFGGQVGLAGHITIGDKTVVGAQSGINSSVKGNQTILGSPAFDYHDFFRSAVIFQKLPEMRKQIEALQKEIEKLRPNAS